MLSHVGLLFLLLFQQKHLNLKFRLIFFAEQKVNMLEVCTK